ncbi:MAG: c-type cytochrome [Verrucomicrobia bacterium]|jgi:cytochrome c oxidase cbb3-type subunit 3|nr:c-type cytochrome [Verrucomicrobiota bacterium]
MNKEPRDPLLLDHEYDGIHELDNKLPRWWVWLFYLTIIFAVTYLCYYHVFARGDLAAQGQMAYEYQREMEIGNAIKAQAVAAFEQNMGAIEPSTDPEMIARGKQSFAVLCAPCHRADGGGLVGPNLTDDYWIHGPAFADNVRTIWNGVEQKGMLAWKKQGMKPSQVLEVASYIYTLRGTELLTPGKPREDQAPVQTGPSEFE